MPVESQLPDLFTTRQMGKGLHIVSPSHVIFSAGHKYDHPRATAAQRYLTFGLPVAKMFRTDLGDDESGGQDKEWAHGRVCGQTDPKGDDDVDILIRSNGQLEVAYRHPH